MENITRFIGIDQSKRSIENAMVEDGSFEIKRKKYSTKHENLESFIRTLRKTDVVGLETGNNAFRLAKLIIKKVGCKVHVLNAGRLHIIFRSMKKTDQEDALRIAKFIQRTPEEELPTVIIPNDEEMAMRSLSTESIDITSTKTSQINRMHNLLWNNGIPDVKRNEMKKKTVRLKYIEQLPEAYKKQALRIEKHIEFLEEQIKELTEEQQEYLIKHEEEASISMSMPGMGIQATFVTQAFLGNMSRFTEARQVAFHSGLTPRIDFSGDQKRLGSITKNGPKQLRRVMNQAAWSAIRSKQGKVFKDFYENIASRRGKKIAIVAVARKMLCILFAMQTKKELFSSVDFESSKERLEKKMKYYGVLKHSLKDCA